MRNLEKRFVPAAGLKLEARAAGDTRPPVISGYAAVFNALSVDLGGFREKIRPGAFRKSIPEADVRALVDHNPTLILGRSKSGTLRMIEDDHGLKVEIDPPDTQAARDLLTSIGRGDVDGMSFGFVCVKDEWEPPQQAGAPAVRELLDVHLFDVSAVTYPAYPDTAVALRSLDDHRRRATPPAMPLYALDAWLAIAEAE